MLKKGTLDLKFFVIIGTKCSYEKYRNTTIKTRMKQSQYRNKK